MANHQHVASEYKSVSKVYIELESFIVPFISHFIIEAVFIACV